MTNPNPPTASTLTSLDRAVLEGVHEYLRSLDRPGAAREAGELRLFLRRAKEAGA